VKWLGYKQLGTGSVVLDMPDIKRRMKAPHVAALSEDAAQAGNEYIHAPTVRDADKRLVCGRDRMAGALLKKRKRMWFHLVEATDQEIAELEERENIYRRHSDGERAQSLARLVELQKQKIRADEKATIGDSVPDRDGASKKGAKSDKQVVVEARKAVARAAGVSPAAVKQAEKRAAAAKAEDGASILCICGHRYEKHDAENAGGGACSQCTCEVYEVEEAEAPDETEQEGAIVYELPEGFNTFGLIVSQDEIREIENITIVLGDWDKANRRTLGHLTDIEKAGGAALAPTHAQKIRERLQAAGHAIRDAIPTSLCYFCKSLDALKAACPACGGTGVVGMHGGDNVPPELKLGEPKARVAVNGKFVLVGAAENAVGAVAAKPSKPSKSIKVTQVDGSVADLDNIDDDAQAF
jgi:ferredoxin